MNKQRNAYDDDWTIVGGATLILFVLFLVAKFM